jgi:hypothetical protein
VVLFTENLAKPIKNDADRTGTQSLAQRNSIQRKRNQNAEIQGHGIAFTAV